MNLRFTGIRTLNITFIYMYYAWEKGRKGILMDRMSLLLMDIISLYILAYSSVVQPPHVLFYYVYVYIYIVFFFVHN